MAGGGAGPAGILPAVTLTATPLAAIRSSRAGSASTPPAVKNVTCSTGWESNFAGQSGGRDSRHAQHFGVECGSDERVAAARAGRRAW